MKTGIIILFVFVLLAVAVSVKAETNVVVSLKKKACLATEPVVVAVTQLSGAKAEDHTRFADLMIGAGTILVVKGTTVVERVKMRPISQPKLHAEGISFFHGLDASSLPPGAYRLSCTLTNWASNEVEFRVLDMNESTANTSDGIHRPAAQALTTNEIVGDWDIAITSTNHVPVFGDLSWKSISFASNTVSWAWERDGKAENHKGTYAIISETPAKAGMNQAFRIEIVPTTLAVPGPLVLKNVTHDLDNRFRLGVLVLKFKDDKDNWNVFLKRKD